MRNLIRLGRLLPLLVLGGTVAFAQDSKGFGAEFKLRYGQQVTTLEDKLQGSQMGFGLGFTYGASWGELGVELGYQIKPGRQYREDPLLYPVASGAPAPAPARSADMRRNELSGMVARLSYQYFPAGATLGYRGGVQLGGARFRHEYVGDVSNNPPTYQDTYNGTPTKSELGVSPFVGLVFRVGEHSRFEVNVLAQRYKSINYNHVAGTVLGTTTAPAQGEHNSQDFLTDTSRTAVHLEVGYAFRF